jgi:beta-mannosidase
MDHPKTSTVLHSGWSFKQRNSEVMLEADFSGDGWRSARVPGTAHTDLMSHGLIPDPFYGMNELDVQWVGETDWLYKIEFEIAQSESARLSSQTDLCLDGLDTFAKVWLNGELILESNNFFLAHRVNVTQKLRVGQNKLQVLFENSWDRGKQLEAANGGPLPVWNGDSSRLYIRKAQYHYGWDWGPKLITTGFWRGVRLETFAARIADVYAPVTVADDLTSAEFAVKLELEGNTSGSSLNLILRDPHGNLVEDARIKASHTEHVFTVIKPELWWPNGHGAQRLYSLEVALERNGTILDSRTLKLGARRLRLLEEPVIGEPGTSFVFEVNNVPIFCGGANWIPDDNFLPRITPERYRERLEMARDGNMNMLRIWGGGIYEDDVFYQACDELGLLVWQDFMFGCGIYPAHPEMLETVKLEAEQNVTRLRNHACLAIWTGNNEDYQIALSRGLYDHTQTPEDAKQFPARVIYERLLPEILSRLDPNRPYKPGSPWAGADPDDQTVGDRHAWNIWGRMALPYQHYKTEGGRFISEFGMAAAPSMQTLRKWLPPEDLTTSSKGFEFHIKADDGARRLNAYLTDLVPMPSDLEGYVYGTQLNQSEALGFAYRIWRRQFGARGHQAVGGALVWQINDCWPVTSWAIIDSEGHAKPGYYAIKRELASITVGLEHLGNPVKPDNNGANVWGMNGTLTTLEVTLELNAFSLDGTKLASESRSVRLEPNQATELGAWKPHVNQPVVIATRLLEGSQVRARASLFPEPYKHHLPQDPNLEITRINETHLRLTVTKPAKGVWLESDDTQFSDNFLDLMPGDEFLLLVHHLGSGLPVSVSVRWLGGQQNFSFEPVLATD